MSLQEYCDLCRQTVTDEAGLDEQIEIQSLVLEGDFGADSEFDSLTF